jgi:hypothetical protein
MAWDLILAAVLAAATPAAATQPDRHFTGVVTRADYQTYKEVPFTVPTGVERITVTLRYDKNNKTVIDLGVRDPSRFRGWSGGARDRFTIAATDATPGYLPGEIPRGRWGIILGVPNIRPQSRSPYTVDVYFDRATERGASAAIADPPIRSGPGWYRGDLHMHDANSDGSCLSHSGKRVPCPLFRTVAAAADAGLDFIAVTDHNTTAHFGGLRELQPYFDTLLLIPGIEITTFGGHANIFAPSRFVDFRVGSRAVPSVRDLQRKVAAAGAILSINHPALPSGELCMGCGWTWSSTDYDAVTAVEAVNGTTIDGPLAGLGFWYARLNDSHRLAGIGTSDNHDPDAPESKAPIGQPRTVVYARELSTPAILDGIRSGNVFVDVEGTSNRLLEVEAEAGEQRAAMGETLPGGRNITVRAHIANAAGALAELIVNGVPTGQPQAILAADARLSLSPPVRQTCGWLAVNVRSKDGKPLLIGNPIYLDCGQTRGRRN